MKSSSVGKTATARSLLSRFGFLLLFYQLQLTNLVAHEPMGDQIGFTLELLLLLLRICNARKAISDAKWLYVSALAMVSG